MSLSAHTGPPHVHTSTVMFFGHRPCLKYRCSPFRSRGAQRGRAEISASHWPCSLFKHRLYKECGMLAEIVFLIYQSSVRSFCHLPCVFCIFQRIASFQQHPLSSHWKWKRVLGRNFPLSGSSFPRWGLSTPACDAVFLSTAVWHFRASTMSCIQSF